MHISLSLRLLGLYCFCWLVRLFRFFVIPITPAFRWALGPVLKVALAMWRLAKVGTAIWQHFDCFKEETPEVTIQKIQKIKKKTLESRRVFGTCSALVFCLIIGNQGGKQAERGGQTRTSSCVPHKLAKPPPAFIPGFWQKLVRRSNTTKSHRQSLNLFFIKPLNKTLVQCTTRTILHDETNPYSLSWLSYERNIAWKSTEIYGSLEIARRLGKSREHLPGLRDWGNLPLAQKTFRGSDSFGMLGYALVIFGG